MSTRITDGPFACPICGTRTIVAETRAVENYLRRRRRCATAECEGRLTTYESADLTEPRHGERVIVPRKDLDALLTLAKRLGGTP